MTSTTSNSALHYNMPATHHIIVVCSSVNYPLLVHCLLSADAGLLLLLHTSDGNIGVTEQHSWYSSTHVHVGSLDVVYSGILHVIPPKLSTLCYGYDDCEFSRAGASVETELASVRERCEVGRCEIPNSCSCD